MNRPTQPRWGGTGAARSRRPFLLTALGPACPRPGRSLRQIGGRLLLLLPLLLLSAPLLAQESIEGTIEVLVADDFDNGRSETFHNLRTDDGVWKLEFTVKTPAGLRTGDRVRVTGRPRGETFVVEGEERTGSVRRLAVAAPADAWTQGPKRLLVILVNFANDTTQPYTVAQAQNTAFGASGSVAAYYGEVSFGSTTLSGDVAGWYTLAMNRPTTCSVSPIATAAATAAQNGGYVLSNYQFRMYVFPRIGACGWAGLASVRGTNSWINQSMSTFVAGHEVGHNYGMLHAHSWDCGAEPIGPTCTRSEYGDPFDIMGGNARHMQAASKSALGWLPAANVVTLSSGSGTHTLFPIETLSAGPMALRLNTDAGRTYWLEFRQAIGFDSALSGNANVMNGALFRLTGSDLLDMTPPTSTFGDAALSVGNTYTDAAASLRVTTVARAGNQLTLDVAFEATPPTPAFTHLPASPVAGQSVTFTNQTTGLPSSFLWDFGDGQTSTLRNPTHAFPAGGTFPVTLTASNAAGPSALATRAVTVTGASAMQLHTVAPCRAVDTRRPNGPLGGPALVSGSTRSFVVRGACGIPATAKAVAINLTAAQSTRGGDFRAIPGGTSLLNFSSGQTRANNAILALGGSGEIAVQLFMNAAGTAHFLIDVTGYLE